MQRGSRLRILLGASIIGTIGVFSQSNWLLTAAVLLLLFSCVRYKPSPPTNYTEKYAPPDPDADPNKGLGAMLIKEGLNESELSKATNDEPDVQ